MLPAAADRFGGDRRLDHPCSPDSRGEALQLTSKTKTVAIWRMWGHALSAAN